MDCIVLFLRPKDWELPEWPLTGEQLNKSRYVHTVEYYAAIKNEKTRVAIERSSGHNVKQAYRVPSFI